MHTADEQAWERSDLLEEITIANVEDLRNDGLESSITITIRHPDLPEGISAGRVYLPVSLAELLQAAGSAVSACKRSVEVGIPKAGSPTFPSVGLRRSLHSASMVVEIVGGDRGLCG